jgi:hypothetical protein
VWGSVNQWCSPGRGLWPGGGEASGAAGSFLLRSAIGRVCSAYARSNFEHFSECARECTQLVSSLPACIIMSMP